MPVVGEKVVFGPLVVKLLVVFGPLVVLCPEVFGCRDVFGALDDLVIPVDLDDMVFGPVPVVGENVELGPPVVLCPDVFG